ncbi:hypothetical protein Y032_0037g3498 [Ancylostoma ceylanicum]|uniref:Uncharacterized protein n=1 Tax=Ancylostoma ceylanicum TaxID=53326 RepID=A0A016UJ41_9BILA|nr:hypothetical protein Y032_0037g3498 [Ancylostoma ceylanicum]
MQRELLKHECTVRELRDSGNAKAFGFEDASNQAQLRRLLCALDITSAGLRGRIQSLSRALLGETSKHNWVEKEKASCWVLLPVGFTVLALGWLIIRVRKIGIL